MFHALADMWYQVNVSYSITHQMVITEPIACTVAAFMANNWK